MLPKLQTGQQAIFKASEVEKVEGMKQRRWQLKRSGLAYFGAWAFRGCSASKLGLGTKLQCVRVWVLERVAHSSAEVSILQARIDTTLAMDDDVGHFLALNKPLARIRALSLASCFSAQQTLNPNQSGQIFTFGSKQTIRAQFVSCFGAQQCIGPYLNFEIITKPLARIRASSLACLVSQQTLGPNQGFKFSMFGLSTNPWPESGLQV